MKCAAACEMHGDCVECEGNVEERSLFMNQILLPLCNYHYREFLKVPNYYQQAYDKG